MTATKNASKQFISSVGSKDPQRKLFYPNFAQNVWLKTN